jgi:hypothetical protein
MKIYYFSKPIVKKLRGYNGFCSYGTGKEKEYTSKEKLIKEFEEMLEFDKVDSLAETEIETIVYDEISDYDYYTIQLETFDGYSITIVTFKTYEECAEWITNQGDEDKAFTIVGQRWGTDYRETE